MMNMLLPAAPPTVFIAGSTSQTTVLLTPETTAFQDLVVMSTKGISAINY
jgi:hypothetical protein